MCWESGKIHTQTPQPRRDIAPRQVWGVFFFVSHSFSPETKKRHQISLDGHKTKAIPIFNVVVFIHFPSKKACPKSSAAPFRQNRPLSFRNHRSEAPADSGYILLKSDRIFQKLRSVQSGKDESNQRKQSSTHFLPRGSADALKSNRICLCHPHPTHRKTERHSSPFSSHTAP